MFGGDPSGIQTQADKLICFSHVSCSERASTIRTMTICRTRRVCVPSAPTRPGECSSAQGLRVWATELVGAGRPFLTVIV